MRLETRKAISIAFSAKPMAFLHLTSNRITTTCQWNSTQRRHVPEPPITHRDISHHRNPAPGTPWNKAVSYHSFFRIIKSLSRSKILALRQRKGILRASHIRIAHAPLEDCAFLPADRPSADCLRKRTGSYPMQRCRSMRPTSCVQMPALCHRTDMDRK